MRVMGGGKFIPIKVLSDEWFKDPEFVREYEVLEVPFAVIGARAHAGRTGRAHGRQPERHRAPRKRPSRPSTTTLARLAAATGTKLRVSFVPDDEAA